MSDGIRLNKYLSDAGVCSRRQADCFIKDGKVRVNGQTADLGTKVMPGDDVTCDEKRIILQAKKVIYAYNKPIGQVCTSKEADSESIFRYIDFPERVTYVGRLDKDSTGLLLLTNDGELSNHIQKSKNNHEKEYHVRINTDVTEEFIEKMSKGVHIKKENDGTCELDAVTKPCKVKKTGARNFSIILTQGLNRQIRRMCQALGVRVIHLKRVRVMNIKLGNLRPGEYRRLTKEEEQKLRSMVSMDKA